MNRLLLIIASYMLILSCFPCMCDDETTTAYHQQELSKEASRGNNNNDDDENCNPFCVCFCCPSPTFFYQKELQVLAPVVFNNTRKFSFTNQHFISHTITAIWQPPKLS